MLSGSALRAYCPEKKGIEVLQLRITVFLLKRSCGLREPERHGGICLIILVTDIESILAINAGHIRLGVYGSPMGDSK